MINFLFFFIILIISIPYVNFSQEIKIYAVSSSSMAPALKYGDLILVKKQKEYHQSEIISFTRYSQSEIITHRLIKKNPYQTKGDANKAEDDWPLKNQQILGKVVFKMPFLGKLIILSKTLLGLILLVIVPTTIIIYQELIQIKKQLFKYFLKRG